MRGLGRKASTLALLAVLATALLGAAYSLWFEDLKVTANVSTGTLDGKIFCGILGDNESVNWPAVPPPSNGTPPFSQYPQAVPLKDVAAGPTGNLSDPHNYQITISNAYPGYMFDCELHINNTGTVPWHLEVQSITVSGPDMNVTVQCTGLLFSDCIAGTLGINTADPIYVEMPNWEGCQVHGSDGIPGFSIFIAVNQPADEGATYTITLNFRVQQWNESAFSGCGVLKP